MKKEILFE